MNFFLKIFLNLLIFELIIGQDINDELENYRFLESFVELKGGEFRMGISDRQENYNNEYPERKALVDSFRIHLYPVSIGSFKKYKNEKYMHKTQAEISGSSWVFNKLKDKESSLDENRETSDLDSQKALDMSMVLVKEARWNRPEGGMSSIRDKLDYPVAHVSYKDAFAYCAWKGMRLPTEIEWEYAARGGLKENLYPWGDLWEVGRTNLWQGNFPEENQLRDGYYGLAPVNAYKAQNNYEMYDLIGNVWEWTSTKYRDSNNNNTNNNNNDLDKRVLKGGSFLNTRDADYSKNKIKIRISARIGHYTNYTAQNVGFRCVQTIKKEEKFFKLNKQFNIVKLRAPKMHSLKPKIHTEL